MSTRRSHLLLYTLLAWLLAPVICFSQDQSSSGRSSFWKNTSIGSKFYYGSFLTTKTKAEYIRDSYAYTGQLFFQHQTNGNQDWQVSHRYPQWGVALLYGNTGSKQYIGNLTAVYAYMNVPLYSRKRYTASFLLGTGPGWVSKPFDIHTNPKNTLIGTRFNAFINLELQNEIRLSKKLYLTGGLSFMHLSNGGTTLPNLGLNTPGITAGIRYAFADPVLEKRAVADTFHKKLGYKVYTTIAIKQAPWIDGNYYVINNLQADAFLRPSRNYSYGAGVLFSYNRSLSFLPLENPSFEKRNTKKMQIGLYGLYEHFFGRLSVPLQMGAYVYNKDKRPVLFQQFGLAYQLTNHLNTILLLKTHTGQADFIHTGIGYNF